LSVWRVSAAKSWDAAENLFEKSNFVESLFFAHLTLEKIIKAHWVKDNEENFPPRIHNLRRLTEQTQIPLLVEQIAFLEQMNTFQIEGRYPDYRFAIYQAFDGDAAGLILEKSKTLYQWILNNLQ
jgi:HEPN domain-containing protein